MRKVKEKIKVFISSKCGVEKYDIIRTKIKEKLKKNNLFECYVFEETGSSILTARQHYSLNLRECDVCIFLIDNSDGVPSGVQDEIDIVKKYNIKALYYFCDEIKKEPTLLQQSLYGADNPKFKVVNTFNDLLDGTIDLIEDIVRIYKYYCKGYLVNSDTSESDFDLKEIENIDNTLIEKDTINNIDKCKNFFQKMFIKRDDEIKKTNQLDELCESFLSVLFNGKSIKEFNVNLLISEIKNYQTPEHYELTKNRWDAIQYYFLGDLQKSISILEDCLKYAKENNLSEWIINDILIDLRNVKQTYHSGMNEILINNPAQDELDLCKRSLYYPIIDRIKENLFEEYLEDGIKDKIQSPYTINLGYNIKQINSLASIYIVAMYNGSLTHLLLLHEQIYDLAFFLSEKFSDWNFKKVLLKEALYSSKKVNELVKYFPDILSKMNSEDALEIYTFCNNQPVVHKKIILKLNAFGQIGYFLSDSEFDSKFNEIKVIIDEWFNDDKRVIDIANNIIKCLNLVHLRITPEYIVDVAYWFITNNYSRFYNELFKLLSNSIDINMLNSDCLGRLISIITKVMDDPNSKMLQSYGNLLILLRKQNKDMTDSIDKKIEETLPNFYKNHYLLETKFDEKEDIEFIEHYIEEIKLHNNTQGKNGVYHGYDGSPFSTIRNIICNKNICLDENKQIFLVKIILETLFLENQTLECKCQAIDLLIFLLIRNNKLYELKEKEINKLFIEEENVYKHQNIFTSNISQTTVMFSLYLLKSVCCKGLSFEILKVIPLIQDDIATEIRISKTINNYLSVFNEEAKNDMLNSILLQLILSWIYSDNLDIRWYCTKNLFLMSKILNINDVLNYQLIRLVDVDNAFIKNIIQRFVVENNVDEPTYNYIKERCRLDSHYVVRKLNKELF